MATVNFNVPDEVQTAFDETFKDQNQGAIIAGLMRGAVEQAQRGQNRHAAIARILERRKHAPMISEEEFRTAREAGRP